MDIMVEIDRLEKRFGPIHAVRGVSFKVRRGEVLGFLGPNGAGKSTTMKMLTCFLSPTSGSAKVCGHDILSDSRRVREKIGYLAEGAPAYSDMTPKGFLEFIAEVRGLKGAKRRERIDYVVETVGIKNVLHQPIETLSKGYKRRVGLAQAIIHDPEVLILDEPTDGLDPNQKHEVRLLIQRMAKNKAIILSTHILEEVDAVCTRAIIIARGTVIFDGTPTDLESRSRYHNAVTLTLDNKNSDEAEELLKKLNGVQAVTREPNPPGGKQTLVVIPANGKSLMAAVADLAEQKKWRVDELRTERGRLDEVFRTLTTKGGDK
jgi:ABC-2 type transport system ATP-binding protein